MEKKMLLSEINNEELMTSAKQKTEPETKQELVEIESRFGKINVDKAKSIFFPNGIYGFPENLHFALANFPNSNLSQFSILQCLNDYSISFPVLPSGFENSLIEDTDMEICLQEVEVEKENFAMLFILSSQKDETGGFSLFANTKAPIIIDTSKKLAIQYVFNNNKYSLKQHISQNG